MTSMGMTVRSKLRLRVQNVLFLLLFGAVIGLLAWLSSRYVLQMDWTAGGRNTLSKASQELLARLDGPLRITAYARDNSSLRGGIQMLVNRYQRYKPEVELTFVNPDAVPEQVRALGITAEGELYLEYQGHGERLQRLTEQNLTNALQRLSRRQERTVLFLTGHGERHPAGIANHDLGNFGRELERTGMKLRELNLVKEAGIGKDAAVLVIASPQVALLPGEVRLVQDYLDGGGNLLWLLEPNEEANLQSLADALGIQRLPGVVVDADTPLLGIDNPAFAVVADYGPHPITDSLQTLTLFPTAAGLEARPVEGWEPEELLLTQPRSWTETGALNGEIHFDPDSEERAGPLTLGVALSRIRPGQASEPDAPGAPRQRVVVVGDGDFLSNAYLGNGGNLTLGLNMLNWLSQDDKLIAIRAKAAPDQTLQLSARALLIIAGGFLVVLPLVLLGSGWLLWWRRQRR